MLLAILANPRFHQCTAQRRISAYLSQMSRQAVCSMLLTVVQMIQACHLIQRACKASTLVRTVSTLDGIRQMLKVPNSLDSNKALQSEHPAPPMHAQQAVSTWFA
jgi:hypothetical protein